MKTNKPKRYLVKPSITFVAANSQEVIEITLREKEVEPIATKMVRSASAPHRCGSAAPLLELLLPHEHQRLSQHNPRNGREGRG